MGGSLKVELTSRALKDLQRIRLFNDELYNESKSREIISDIFRRIETLESLDMDFAEIGSVDEDFVHLKYKYRKLMEGHHKITYRKGKKSIYIVRIFDTRQNPFKNR